jgi:hypothetical protein
MLRDLIEAPLESTHPANANEVLGSAASVLVVDCGVLVRTWQLLTPYTLKLGLSFLSLFSRNQRVRVPWASSASIPSVTRGIPRRLVRTTDIVGRIDAADMSYKGRPRTCQPPQDGLTPFHDKIFDYMLPEKRKDLLGNLVGSLGGGRTRVDTDPYDCRSETPLLLLSGVGWVKN